MCQSSMYLVTVSRQMPGIYRRIGISRREHRQLLKILVHYMAMRSSVDRKGNGVTRRAIESRGRDGALRKRDVGGERSPALEME